MLLIITQFVKYVQDYSYDTCYYTSASYPQLRHFALALVSSSVCIFGVKAVESQLY